MSNVYKIPYERSFASHEKAKFWHPTMNGDVVPRGVFISTNKKFWFSCDTCKHNFNSSLSHVSNKTNPRWCSYCSKKNLCDDNLCQMCFNNSFASHEKSKYWSKKNEKNPRDVFKCTNKKYWFNCDKCPHTFETFPNNIVNGSWCPYCPIVGEKKLCDDDKCNFCFENSFGSHSKSRFWSNKNKKTPREVTKSNGFKYWFNCDKCHHSFETRPCGIVHENIWCPYCGHKCLCQEDSCDFCFNNSFASHPKEKLWSKKNEKSPRQLFKNDIKKFWFDCDKCNHSFDMTLNSVNTGRGCPYCSHHLLCKDMNCDFCFKNSFASHPKAKYWASRNKENPRELFRNSYKKYWFDCDKCNHTFDIRLSGITTQNNWCRYCSHHLLCKDMNCDFCFKNSFASHPKVKYWSIKNKTSPRDLFKWSGSSRNGETNKYWFDCDKCNRDFSTSLGNITKGTWCPHCVNKTEAKMKDHLEREKENLYIKSIKHHYRPKWTKVHGTSYEYDFYIELTNGVKIIIEIDGRQHYEQVSNWQTPLYNQIRDCIKERLAGNQEINLIRLNQEAIWEDKRNWQQILHSFIQKKYVNNNEIEIYDACQW